MPLPLGKLHLSAHLSKPMVRVIQELDMQAILGKDRALQTLRGSVTVINVGPTLAQSQVSGARASCRIKMGEPVRS